jgi:hypothetical protein
VTTSTAHSSSSSTRPHILLAVVAAAGISFIAGEKVGIRLATSGAAHGAAASAVAGVEASAGPAAPGAAEVTEAQGIGPDCNTNYR